MFSPEELHKVSEKGEREEGGGWREEGGGRREEGGGRWGGGRKGIRNFFTKKRI
jgi:hypothetical protein